MKPPVTGVDPDKVGQVVQDFIDYDKITELGVNQQPDGTFTVTPEE